MLLASIISLLLFSGPAKQTPGDSVYVQEATLHFRWDKSDYEDTYLQNADAADKLCKFLEMLGEERIDSVIVDAYASPEGVYEHNMKLSRDRAKQFRIAMQDRMAMDGLDVKLKVRPGGEAWDQLRKRIVEDTTVSELARSRILKVLDDNSVSRSTKKWRMMHNALGATRQEGDVYHWMLLNHYRYLRCLQIKIYTREHWVKEALGHEVVVIETPATEAPATEAPVTEKPATETPVTEKPATEAPAGQTESTEAPATEKPATEASATEKPATEKPAGQTESTEAPTTEVSATETPAIPDAPQSRPLHPVLGVSTNLLYDATYIPNYGFTSIPSFSLEYYPAKGKYTFGADVEWPMWKHPEEHRYMQINNVTLWTRYYFKPEPLRFNGPYVLGSVNGARYGIGWNEKGWEGEGLGLSVGGGYKWTFGRFYIDLGGSLGAFYSKYDPYVWGNDATGWYYYDYSGDPAKFTSRRMRWFWFGPTRLQVSVGFDLFNRRK